MRRDWPNGTPMFQERHGPHINRTCAWSSTIRGRSFEISAVGFFRFRRSFRILPGLRLNLGKRSSSVSVGGRGAHVTFGGPRGTRTTIGLPGTGLSYTEVPKPAQAAQDAAQQPVQQASAARGWLWILLAIAIVAAVLLRAVT